MQINRDHSSQDPLSPGLSLHGLAFFVTFAPIVTVHISYWIAAGISATVPECIPYWDGCTSISATGRYPPANFLFRPAMIAHGVLLAVFWVCIGPWLERLGVARRPVKRAVWVGIIGALFLILYTTFLGSSGDFYNLMRRYGVTVYFAFTILACMLLARQIVARFGWGSTHVVATMARRQVKLFAILLLLGLASIPAQNFTPDSDRIENVVEWTLSVLMQGNFLIYGWALEKLRVRLAISSA